MSLGLTDSLWSIALLCSAGSWTELLKSAAKIRKAAIGDNYSVLFNRCLETLAWPLGLVFRRSVKTIPGTNENIGVGLLTRRN